jgi:hemerythrin-like domain-containing protein
MEDRLEQLEKDQERLEKEVLHYAKKFVEKGDR